MLFSVAYINYRLFFTVSYIINIKDDDKNFVKLKFKGLEMLAVNQFSKHVLAAIM